MNITFKILQKTDLSLLHQWFQEPMVKKWYARDIDFSLEDIHKKYLPRILGQENVFSFIVNLDEKSIGFIQYYALNHYLPEGIQEKNAIFRIAKSNQMAGIDFFIGEPSCRGKGLGQKILLQFSKLFLKTHFLIEIVDPSVHNKRAIGCYQQCGFTGTSYSEDKNFIILIKQHVNNLHESLVTPIKHKLPL